MNQLTEGFGRQAKVMLLIIFAYVASRYGSNILSMSSFFILQEFALSKAQYGLVLALGTIASGVSLILHSILIDACRVHLRIYLTVSLLVAGVSNLILGLIPKYELLFLSALVNGWAMGIFIPASIHIIANKYSKAKRGICFATFDMGKFVFAGLFIVNMFVAGTYGWPFGFFIASAVAIFFSVLIFLFLRDADVSKEIVGVEENQVKESFHSVLLNKVVKNTSFWFVCVMAFCLFGTESTFNEWSISFLNKSNVTLGAASIIGSYSALIGVIGGLLAAFFSDVIFKAKRCEIGFVFTIITMVSLMALAFFTVESPIVGVMAFFLFICGAKIMVYVLAVDVTSKKIAATAVLIMSTCGGLGAMIFRRISEYIANGFDITGIIKMLLIPLLIVVIFFIIVRYAKVQME